MAWIYLVFAGLLEIGWAFSMKRSEGFSLPGPTILTFVLMASSFGLLALAMRSLPLGTAYTIWTGIGAIGAFTVGILILGEAASPMRLIAAGLIVAGLVLMKTAG
ncbi:MAG: multidrug efflux SMR transporter [Paracoccus sp. (in: a-proteobacteria)]|uniref:DMT family transporter n=1 Tax=Paracoccus sp. TaxID=267 RepID=UPI0026E0FC93|nr:multidrug efflux SMR transporter [Paracoccus sp. (in: a-proteobacteria)]MDO5613234.1 multidrug efflux SMR transporter [Paracoccus sp. (in: a-proteobacteria)]